VARVEASTSLLARLPFCRPLRGLAIAGHTLTQGSRTRPGLHASARYAGCASLAEGGRQQIRDYVVTFIELR
jgi:hypothetical protein